MATSNANLPPSGEGLSAAECKLLSHASTGTLLDLRADDADNPARASCWDATRTIQAGLLAELLTSEWVAKNSRLRAVRLRGARITGPLDLEARTLACPLFLQDCHIEQAVNLTEAIAPSIGLPGCHVPALAADQLRITGNLILSGGFTANGEVDLSWANIGGQLDLNRAVLGNANGRALFADGLTVGHNLYCGKGFTARGEVRLVGARITGYFMLSGAHLSNDKGPALAADGLIVGQGMHCNEFFTAHGEVRMSGACIGGQLGFDGACLSNDNGPALLAEALDVGHDMLCREGFTAHGEVRIHGARIRGQLDLSKASLVNQGRVCLDIKETNIASVRLLPRQRPDGDVDMTNARVGPFVDDPKSWPDTLRLRGLVYDTLENGQVSVQERLGWLTRHRDGYTPQIYDQLSAAYRRAGNDQAARKVAVAKQWRRRRTVDPLNWLWYVTVGYGYRTWLAGGWLAMLLAIGTWVFSRAHMITTATHPPTLHPLAYTLDVILPIVNFGQKSAWQPQGRALYWSWALTGAGWVLTAAVVAGLTGILKRD